VYGESSHILADTDTDTESHGILMYEGVNFVSENLPAPYTPSQAY